MGLTPLWDQPNEEATSRQLSEGTLTIITDASSSLGCAQGGGDHI